MTGRLFPFRFDHPDEKYSEDPADSGQPVTTRSVRDRDTSGAREIRAALGESRRLFLSIALFSAFVNLLMLTGPLFMLQVYDRVLTSRSEATLVALVLIVAFLFLMMGLLDHFRARVLARAGARFQARLDPRVLGAILTRAGRSPQARSAPATGLADLEAMQRFASGPGPFAFFDAPWTPIFLFVLFAFHWLLGALAVFSGRAAGAAGIVQLGPDGAAPGRGGRGVGPRVPLRRAGAGGRRDGTRPRHAPRGSGACRRTAQCGSGRHAGGVRPGRRLCSGLEDAAAVPAVDDAGPRRLARDPG